LSSADFDTWEAYEDWKKSEAPDLSQMILAIIQAIQNLLRVRPAAIYRNLDTKPMVPPLPTLATQNVESLVST